MTKRRGWLSPPPSKFSGSSQAGLPKVIPFVFKQRKAVPSILVQEEEIEKSA